MSNLIKRLLTGIILFPLVLILIWKGGFYFEVLFSVCIILAVLEWLKLCIRSPLPILKSNIWFIVGLLYILIAGWGFYQLRFLSQTLGFPEPALQLLLVAIIAVTDTSAYFIGKLFKGPKLAPAVSPNKTWSGALGALVVSVIFSILTLSLYGFSFKEDKNFSKIYIGTCLCISLVGQIGDLLESFVKRYFRVKDSGKLIPGHGGILDRTDSILAVSFLLGCVFLILSL